MNSEIESFISEKREIVNKTLQRYYPLKKKNLTQLNESIRYSILADGKRLRPVLCLTTCEAFSGDCTKAINVACAIEMIHTYSLIHDDLPSMDNDTLRRGLPTNHKVYGEALAILAGDSLLTDAFNILANKCFADGLEHSLILKLIEIISDAAGSSGMIAGQALDLDNQGNIDIDVETLDLVNSLKTGAMIEASVVSGAIIGGAMDSDIEKLSVFSRSLGLAYQIIDDILDQEGGAELGKTINSDKKKNKPTYLSILGIEKSEEIANKLTTHAISSLDTTKGNCKRLVEVAEYLVKRKH